MTDHPTVLCNDYGDAPDCLGAADARYTMNFDDIDKGSIYWCAICGPRAHAMEAAILEAFKTRPDFEAELRAAIDEQKALQVKQ